MAKGVNKVLLLGNVGRAPDVRSTANGTLVASFSLATPDSRKENGKWIEVTEWHNVVCFGRTAEIVRDYAPKGAKLYIEGKLQTRSWDDKNSGEKRYRTEIVAFDITLLGGKPKDQAAKPADENEYPGYAYTREVVTDDDIPF